MILNPQHTSFSINHETSDTHQRITMSNQHTLMFAEKLQSLTEQLNNASVHSAREDANENKDDTLIHIYEARSKCK